MNPKKKENQLFLIPTPISRKKENHVLPEYTIDIIHSLDCFIVEKVQTAQSFLQWINHPKPIHELKFRVLNKKTPEHEVISFVKLLEENPVGLMSEAGAPAVADPGSSFTRLAHGQGYRVVPLIGPSSILLALMASGLNGQKFSFHGYLSRNDSERPGQIQTLERESSKGGFTQIIMDTPHRNLNLFRTLVETLRPSTSLCVAVNITGTDEWIQTARIADWKKREEPILEKKPALFLLNAV